MKELLTEVLEIKEETVTVEELNAFHLKFICGLYELIETDTEEFEISKQVAKRVNELEEILRERENDND